MIKVQTRPLREHVNKEFDRLVEKFPNLANALQALRGRTLSRFPAETIDLTSMPDCLEAIVKDAEEIDTDGYLFAIGQQLADQLEGLSRNSLSEGVPVFPEIQVTLGFQRTDPGVQPDMRVAQPGSRTKLGGKPQWIQSDATPICVECQKAMTFVAQIDSLANQHTDLGRFLASKGSFMFADVGMIYLFWCSGCNATQSVLQCD